MIRLSICGAAGRMGRAILEEARQRKEVEVVGLLEKAGNPLVGEKLEGIPVTDKLKEALEKTDMVIDFTSPEAALANAKEVAKAGKALVAGTTGIAGKAREEFVASVKGIPVVFSPNMSLGANVLFSLVEKVAALLPEYDAEVVEIHHSLKKDSPSGTAQRLAEGIAKIRKFSSWNLVHGRQGLVGERKIDEIGLHAVRGGDVVGDHTVLFLGRGERLELVHRVGSRAALAQGALTAALWLAGKKPGLYDMYDVLGIKGS